MNLTYKNEKPLFAIALIISAIFWVVFIFGTLGIGLIYLLLFFLFYLFAQSAFISYIKGSGVKVTAEQFPDLYQRLISSCETVGQTKIPDAYILRTDFFNALATRFLGRNFLVLFSDVVDALEDHPDALNFYIGHELGHIHRKHLIWAPIIFPATLLPLLGYALRRAEEYTCDRYGVACCKHEDDVKFAMAAIAAGNSRWKSTNISAYLAQIKDTSGFWMSFNELISDYPWLTKRMAAALSFKNNTPLVQPNRNIAAYFFAILVPRLGIGGGLSSVIIIVAIVGILAAIALPAYQDYSAMSKNTSGYHIALQIQQDADAYYLQHNTMPESLDDLGYESQTITQGRHHFSADIYDGVIRVNVGTVNNAQYVLLVPQLDDSRLYWVCDTENIKPATIPRACRQY